MIETKLIKSRYEIQKILSEDILTLCALGKIAENNKPVLIWKDPLGNYLVLINNGIYKIFPLDFLQSDLGDNAYLF